MDPQDLKFERKDWTSFRTIEGLSQKAGVAKGMLPRLVLKELADNGLDAGAAVTVGEIPNGYFIEDIGPGLDGTPEDIARLFSISRPLVSTKLLRLPTRGALGNGLRVVAGAVLASEGFLTVITRNRRISLRPERDGTTTVVGVEPVHQIGTRIEIGFGLLRDANALSWAQTAINLARGQTYSGKTSPWWYDAANFHELLDATGDQPVRELVANSTAAVAARQARSWRGLVSVAQHVQPSPAPRPKSSCVSQERTLGRQAPSDSEPSAQISTATCKPTPAHTAAPTSVHKIPWLRFHS
jgi:hypothetical protein